MDTSSKTVLNTSSSADRSAQAAPESALMSAAAGNDPAAIAELVSRRERGVRRDCVSLLGDEALAREAALSTFTTVWETRAAYRPTRHVPLHLLGVARYLSRRLALRCRLGFSALTDVVSGALTVITWFSDTPRTSQDADLLMQAGGADSLRHAPGTVAVQVVRGEVPQVGAEGRAD